MLKTTSTPASLRITLRVLARLLDYPDAQLRPQVGELLQALAEENVLGKDRLAELHALGRQLAQHDMYALQERYVETFDRGRDSGYSPALSHEGANPSHSIRSTCTNRRRP